MKSRYLTEGGGKKKREANTSAGGTLIHSEHEEIGVVGRVLLVSG